MSFDPETLATLRDFSRCLDPETAIVNRQALEEAIAHLAAEKAIQPGARANSIVIHHIEPERRHTPVVVIDGGRCRHCGAPR